MMSYGRGDRAAFGPAAWSRIAMALAIGWNATIAPAMAQPAPPAAAPGIGAGTSTTPPPPEGGQPPAPPQAQGQPQGQPQPQGQAQAQPDAQEKPYTLSDLTHLLAPIALYPDTLLALILPASTVPLDIVHADRWLDANEEAVKRGDFSGVDASNWEMSVQALARFPDIVRMLADNLEWTESLGMAFAMQPDDVTAAVQILRAQAHSRGNLSSTPQQVVNVRQEGSTPIITILPANPELIYVPVYDSSTVFTTAAVGAVAFAAGIAVGSYWNDRWGWDDRRWRSVAVPRPGWRPPPQWNPYRSRPGVPPSEWGPRPNAGIYDNRRPGPAARPPGWAPAGPSGGGPSGAGMRPRPGMPPAPGAVPSRVPPPSRAVERPSGPAGSPPSARQPARDRGPAMRPDRPAPSSRPAASGRPAPSYRPPQREARPPRQMQARPSPSGPPREFRQPRPQRPQPQMRQGSGRPPPQAKPRPSAPQQQKGRPQPKWQPER